MSIDQRINARRVIALSILGLGIPTAAYAQATDPATVIVSGKRFEEDLERTIGGATVITAVDIARSGATTIPEALAKLGGVHVRNNSGSPNWQVDLRGFGMTGDQNTLILLDGQRISENELAPTRMSAIPLNAIERIEILRGIGAVMYGRGATAGTINIITRKPGSNGSSATIQGAVGSFHTHDLRGTAEFDAGSFGMLLSASDYATRNARQNNVVRVRNVEGNLRFQGDGQAIALRFGSGRESLGFPADRTLAQFQSNPGGTSTPNDSGLAETWHAGAGWQAQLGAAEAAIDLDFRNKYLTNYFPSSPIYSSSDMDTLTLAPRLRWKSGPVSLVAGAELARWSYAQTNVAFGFPGAARATQSIDAAYIRTDVEPLSGTLLSFGVRDERATDSFTKPAVATKTVGMLPYELGLKQQFGGGVSGYGRLGRSYRLATVDENYDSFMNTVTILRPQKSLDAELGVQWRRSADRIRAAVFESRLTDEIHPISIPGAGFANTANANLAPTLRRGVELEGQWAATKALVLGANYRHVRATFRSGTYFGTSVSGNEVPLVPRHVGAVNASWRVAEGKTVSGSWRYVGTQRYDNDQVNRVDRMPAYQLLDLKYTQQLARWSWSFALDNVFDKKYYSYGIRNNAGTSANVYPELGRRAMLSVELRY